MLIVEKKPKSVTSEAYRTLRTNIEYSSFDSEIKTILITSAESKEGKSTISSNMALSFAENDKRVILIDCDLRKPSIHKMFNISNGYGLSEVLIGSKRLEEAVRSYSSNLDILPCGTIPPNPAKMVGSKAMESLLNELKESYDVIILDSSPVRIVTDAQILSTKVDGTIVVVRKDETKLDSIKETKKLLDKVGANIIGCILNGVEGPKKKDYSYYTSKEVAKNPQ